MQNEIPKTLFSRGYVHVYTGNGKGKTSAALGLAFRAAGHGLKTYIAQFMKGQAYGELASTQRIPEITIEQFGKDTFIHVDEATDEDILLAQNGLNAAKTAMHSGEYDIIVLDEINVAIHFKLVTIQSIIDFVKSKPKNIELVLTGRYAPTEILDIADLVTEMVPGKHYYTAGVMARDGIER